MMPNSIPAYIATYLAAVSLVAIVLTVYDKRAATRGSWRIKERTLVLISVIGGSVTMLIAMRMIQHKTKQPKFMVGIPVIIILQIAIGVFGWWLMKGGAL